MMKSAPLFISTHSSVSNKKRLTISLDEGDHGDLLKLAEQEERSLNWVVVQAVRYYLEQVKSAPRDRLPRENQTRLPL
jgi:hypothetical protein